MAGPHKIDYDNFVYDDCLKRIIGTSSFDINKTPKLEMAWIIEFPPRKSNVFLKFVKNSVMDKDPISFQHLKRIRKSSESATPALSAIACSVEFISQKKDLLSLIGEYDIELQKEIIISKKEVPNNYPYNKELSDSWSKEYWPTIWKGNPLIQELNQVRISIDDERKYLKEITEISQTSSENGKLPIVTMFRDPKSDKTITVQEDARDEKTPLSHSIMDCIQKIADLEMARRNTLQETSGNKNYLCLNYHVYTTHEPCSMCVMALIHSRIGKLTYIKSSPATGSVEESSGLGYGIDKFSGLNWKFDSWKWCGPDFQVAELDDAVFV